MEATPRPRRGYSAEKVAATPRPRRGHSADGSTPRTRIFRTKDSPARLRYGCALVLAGRDEHGCGLYRVDPSGWYAPWRATCVGEGAPALSEKLAEGFDELRDLDAARARLVELLAAEDRVVAVAAVAADGALDSALDLEPNATVAREAVAAAGETDET